MNETKKGKGNKEEECSESQLLPGFVINLLKNANIGAFFRFSSFILQRNKKDGIRTKIPDLSNSENGAK